MHKYYGGFNWFEDKPVFLLLECLKHGIEKESEIPRIIETVYKNIFGEKDSTLNKNMRSKEDILKDYGMEVAK